MSAQIRQKIEDEYAEIRLNNENIRQKRIEEVYAKIPRIIDADKKLDEIRGKMIESLSNKYLNLDELQEEVNKVLAGRAKLLKENGFPENYTFSVYSCEKCKDTGFNMAIPCECYQKMRIKYLFEYSNLTETMKGQTFDKFSLEKYSKEPISDMASPYDSAKWILARCQRLVDADEYKNGTNLYIYGTPGLGKTFLCSAISNALLEKGVAVLYQTAYSITSEMEEKKFKYADNDDKTNLFYSVPVLIIDDLGTEFQSVFSNAAIFDLVNARINKKLTTVISTNLTIDDVKANYGLRLQSRIIGEFELLKLSGNDIRAGKL